jgi:DNA ligase-1
LREDKGVEQATSAEQVADFYNAQATKVDYGGGDDDDL